ncbi:arginase [Biomaibacter acetigenes]|uniref:Arginase n=1 Tax=Biomaibacter acetigenes TaxID=2316383 RepID=A0A3G2RAS9_9FIRM|nr:arginase [Biomaibacter acetigenes]AYO31847.1 arginase [Biomaibacter acetigenes]RKL62389.1 arginase [Thermoanaerobacteraceae bacterium SP2]
MKVRIIGVPMDLGADRRGVDMGPSAIRYAHLQQRLEENGIIVEDGGNIEVPNPESRKIKDEKLKYLHEIVESSERTADAVSGAIEDGFKPLVLGGDHSIALGSVTGVSRVLKKIGLIWIDAHGDFNTQDTTPSGNIHGMILAASLGLGHEALTNVGGFSPKVLPENTVLIGVRSIDRDEKRLIRESGINVFTMNDIDQCGMRNVMKKAIKLAGGGTAGVHLSFDMDVLDPMVAPGVGTPVRGGITYREAALAMEMLAESGIIRSLEFVEVNPILDRGNETAKVAVGLIASALGEEIL